MSAGRTPLAAGMMLLGLAVLAPAGAQTTLHGGVSIDQEAPTPPTADPPFDGPVQLPAELPAAIGGALGGLLDSLLSSGSAPKQRYDVSLGQVWVDAQRAAAAIDQAADRGGTPGDAAVAGALERLRDEQTRLPPELPRPARCYGIMVGGWVSAQQHRPANARTQTGEALDCYRNAVPATAATVATDGQCTAPPDLPQQLMAFAAQLDRIATGAEDYALVAPDRFITGMSGAIAANLRWMAQRPGVPAAQLEQAIELYLTADNATNHAQLYQAALQAVDAFRSDPAQFVGAQAGNAVAGAALGGAGGLCRRGMLRLANVAQSVKAGQRLMGLAQAEQRFARSFGANLQQARNAGVSAAPCFAENACFPTALARAELWREQPGIPVRVRGVYATGAQDIRTSSDQVIERLRAQYGQTFTPRNPSAYTAQELTNIRNGIPIPATAARIEQLLTQSGEGSQGLVFVHYTPEVLVVPGQPSGHVFNVRLHNGAIEWLDETIATRDPRPNFKWMTDGAFYPVQ